MSRYVCGAYVRGKFVGVCLWGYVIVAGGGGGGAIRFCLKVNASVTNGNVWSGALPNMYLSHLGRQLSGASTSSPSQSKTPRRGRGSLFLSNGAMCLFCCEILQDPHQRIPLSRILHFLDLLCPPHPTHRFISPLSNPHQGGGIC